MDTPLLTKLTVGLKVGVSSVSLISESVSIIPWICQAFAKYIVFAITLRYETALTKKMGTRTRTETTLLLPRGMMNK